MERGLPAGSLRRQKNQDLHLTAWPRVWFAVPGAHLALEGDAPDRRRLAASADGPVPVPLGIRGCGVIAAEGRTKRGHAPHHGPGSSAREAMRLYAQTVDAGSGRTPMFAP